jgi:peptidyl-prolyl cis-trans isomerase D
VTVSDQEVRDDYRKQNIKIKFDYAVISSDDLRKTINPSDSDLEAFFKKNAARYASAVPEERKITYFAFTPKPDSRRRSAAHAAADSAVLQRSTRASTRFRSRRGRGTSSSRFPRARMPRPMRRPRPRPRRSEAAAGRRQLGRPGEEELRRPRQQGLGRRTGFRKAAAWCRSLTGHLLAEDRRHQIVKSQFGYHIVQVEERSTACAGR